ncbi:unnamed protein product [Rotaria sp. Silwood2]|nr:unnamed protein product [Rotaria sp. Silwood2]CAF4453833.1 unnamed protein product [Rotaria sp. Silwood2]
MSNRFSKNNSQSSNSQDNSDRVWNDLEIYFTLENSLFFDNKIYGTVEISNEKAREIIKNFVLVVNNSIRVEFNPNFQNILASGFDPTKGNTLVYIEAIPKDRKMLEFSILRKHSSLASTIMFEKKNNDSSPNVIVQWFHLGDSIAQKYILVLDDKEIVYIRRPSQSDMYKVCIEHLKLDKEISHTIYIIARLNNDKETYRSDPIRFTIPDQVNEENSRVIEIYVEKYANQFSKGYFLSFKLVFFLYYYLLIQLIYRCYFSERKNQKQDNNKKISSISGNKQHTPKTMGPIRLQQPPKDSNRRSETTCTYFSGCCDVPHETFPGISHYFKRMSIKTLSSSSIQSTSTNNHKETLILNIDITYSNKKDTDDDDDDNDVIDY